MYCLWFLRYVITFFNVAFWDFFHFPVSISFCGTFRIPVDSFQETSGGSRMLIRISNLYDSSTSTTNQRQRNEVYQTPRFRAPDAYPYRHARVAASRCLRQNDGNRKSLSNIQDLPLPTAFDGEPAVGNAVQR